MKEAQICQSCGMPMEKSEDFGTNADGNRNEDSCCFCFKNGDFTNPDLTMEQMINKIVGFADRIGTTQAQAREMAQTVTEHTVDSYLSAAELTSGSAKV